MRRLFLIGLMLLWASAGVAEERCSITTTALGRSATEDARIYRDYHECMMKLADGGYDALPTGPNKIPAGSVQEGGACLTGSAAANSSTYETFACDQSRWVRLRSSCEQKMEAAMRAMERYQERQSPWVEVTDATTTISNTWITPVPMPDCCDDPFLYSPKPEPPPPPTLEEKIETLERETAQKIKSMKKAAADAEEARGQSIVNRAYRKWAFEQWDAVKRECWREK